MLISHDVTIDLFTSLMKSCNLSIPQRRYHRHLILPENSLNMKSALEDDLEYEYEVKKIETHAEYKQKLAKLTAEKTLQASIFNREWLIIGRKNSLAGVMKFPSSTPRLKNSAPLASRSYKNSIIEVTILKNLIMLPKIRLKHGKKIPQFPKMSLHSSTKFSRSAKRVTTPSTFEDSS